MRVTHAGTLVHWMIGSPIAQVRMPALANAHFQNQGLDELLVPLEVQPDGLAAALGLYAAAANTGGLLSTLPHKAALASLVDARSPRSAVTGVVNVVRKAQGRLFGDILDGAALGAVLARRGVPLRGITALVVGCGGFGSAAAFELLAAGARSVALADTDSARAHALGGRLQAYFGAARAQLAQPDSTGPFQLLVQASPAGMRLDDAAPCDARRIEGLLVVVEAVTGGDTALLQQARELGLVAVTGDEIAEAQLAPVIDFWNGAGGAEAC